MKNRSCCNRVRRPPSTNQKLAWFLRIAACVLACVSSATAGGDAPQWMHALVAVPLPSYDEKTNAVLLYSETNLTVVSEEKVRTQVREAYKILRPAGREHGLVGAYFHPVRKITNLRGWCIPAQGKDYEVKEKDAIETSAVEGFEVFSDVKYRSLHIPAPDPGNIIGYEYEVEEQPYFLQDIWRFQRTDPVRESHYSLQLPPGWEYKASWLSYPEVKPIERGGNVSLWTVSDVKGIRHEPEMPPWAGLAGQLVVSFFPAGGSSRKNELASWEGMGSWYANLTDGRMDSSDAIRQAVSGLAAGKTATLAKMQAIAGFLQRDIRYVEISLGIGGGNPHADPYVLSHKNGV
jgi:hypothetical protein